MPTCANFAVKKTAAANKPNVDLEVVTSAQRDLYMDDFIKSLANTNMAIRMAKDMNILMKSGGFKLTKWISNQAEVLLALQEAGLELAADMKETHVLGIKWSIQDDKLIVGRGTAKEFKEQVTQRQALAAVSSVFDPLGVIAPFTIRAR